MYIPSKLQARVTHVGRPTAKVVETLGVDASVQRGKKLEREPWGAPTFEGSEKGKRSGRGGVTVLRELCPGSQGKRTLRKEGVTP